MLVVQQNDGQATSITQIDMMVVQLQASPSIYQHGKYL
jgi:hypothetical protein